MSRAMSTCKVTRGVVSGDENSPTQSFSSLGRGGRTHSSFSASPSSLSSSLLDLAAFNFDFHLVECLCMIDHWWVWLWKIKKFISLHNTSAGNFNLDSSILQNLLPNQTNEPISLCNVVIRTHKNTRNQKDGKSDLLLNIKIYISNKLTYSTHYSNFIVELKIWEIKYNTGLLIINLTIWIA